MKIIDVATILVNVYRYGLLAAVAVLLLFFRRLDRYHKSLLVYLMLMLAMEYSISILGKMFGNNHMALPVFALIELCFFAYFYRTFYLFGKFRRIFLPPFVAAALLIIIEFIYYFTLHKANPHVYQPYSKVAEDLVVLGMAFVVLNDAMSGKGAATTHNGFWFNLVVIMYFTFNTVFFLPFNFMVNAPTDVKFAFWMTHTLSIVGFYGFLSSRILRYAMGHVRVNS
ncbi:hypothetical protein ACLI1A_01445 [Flavobacterium sp. RHBU_3]|uniref:hypothetical protein n=1 Tax=Flavobacterium sp. RHBU_3 TaxID=3391184 RepID=UPI00398462D0